MPRHRQLAGHLWRVVISRLIADPPPFVQMHTRFAVLLGELDTGAFQRALDLGQGLDHPADRAFAAFHALHGGDVDTGPLGKLARGPTQERAPGEFGPRSTCADFHHIAATLR